MKFYFMMRDVVFCVTYKNDMPLRHLAMANMVIAEDGAMIKNRFTGRLGDKSGGNLALQMLQSLEPIEIVPEEVESLINAYGRSDDEFQETWANIVFDGMLEDE